MDMTPIPQTEAVSSQNPDTETIIGRIEKLEDDSPVIDNRIPSMLEELQRRIATLEQTTNRLSKAYDMANRDVTDLKASIDALRQRS